MKTMTTKQASKQASAKNYIVYYYVKDGKKRIVIGSENRSGLLSCIHKHGSKRAAEKSCLYRIFYDIYTVDLETVDGYNILKAICKKIVYNSLKHASGNSDCTFIHDLFFHAFNLNNANIEDLNSIAMLALLEGERDGLSVWECNNKAYSALTSYIRRMPNIVSLERINGIANVSYKTSKQYKQAQAAILQLKQGNHANKHLQQLYNHCTTKQAELLTLLLQGYTLADIAFSLGTSQAALSARLESIRKKYEYIATI